MKIAHKKSFIEDNDLARKRSPMRLLILELLGSVHHFYPLQHDGEKQPNEGYKKICVTLRTQMPLMLVTHRNGLEDPRNMGFGRPSLHEEQELRHSDDLVIEEPGQDLLQPCGSARLHAYLMRGEEHGIRTGHRKVRVRDIRADTLGCRPSPES
jgi:hypothetical protein